MSKAMRQMPGRPGRVSAAHGEAVRDLISDEASGPPREHPDTGSARQPAGTGGLLEAALTRQNLQLAWKRIKANKGAAGVDGLDIEQTAQVIRQRWPDIRQALLQGRYRPSPVRKVMIPKPDGSQRELGIPTVLDRLIQQALLQVLQPLIDPTFSEHSYGFRPGRRAHDAVKAAQTYVQSGRRVVVDVDLAKFFDRVNHDILIDRLKRRIDDAGVIRLVRAYLKAGIMDDGVVVERHLGTPQGGPLSPLLANVLLDEVDKALEARGCSFARYADDCNVYVGSTKAGERVMAYLRKLYGGLKLEVNEAKSAVASAFGRKFLGYALWVAKGKEVKCKVAAKPLQNFKARMSGNSHAARAGAAWRRSLTNCGPTCTDGRRTLGWRRHPGSGGSWTNGCATDCEPSSCGTGSDPGRSTGNSRHWGRATMWPTKWRATATVGGATAMESSGAC